MEEQLITLDTAKLAKVKGFDLKRPCSCGGYPECICDVTLKKIERKDSDKAIYRPTQSLLQKWLREEHNQIVYVTPFNNGWVNNLNNLEYGSSTYFKLYEIALEKGLYEALTRIKQ